MFLPSTITLKPGDSGDFVSELQRRLAAADCFNRDAVNGFYDGMTTNSVMAFQGRSGLHADGIAGPETLRRLNGVVSGDATSSGSDKKEEDKQSDPNQFVRQEIIMDQQAALAPIAPPERSLEPERTIDPFAPAAFPGAAMPTPQEFSLAAHSMHTAQPLMPSHSPAADMLTQMMHQTPAQGAEASVTAAHAHANATGAPTGFGTYSAPASATHHQPMIAQVPQNPAPVAAPNVAAMPPAAPAQQSPAAMQPAAASPTGAPGATQAPAAEQPRGLVGRAVQYANEMVQKLSNYFEAKLPPSVLSEVQSIGQAMMQHGVKEVPIPQEATLRAPELPSRGPQQAPAQQRN